MLEAIAELKARGLEVFLYPFLMMDVPLGNGLPDPYGGAEQAAYPWRGRITGAAGTDKTAAAASAVTSFFGTAAPANFRASGEGVSYAGPSEWSCRRLILHHAALAQAAGGVDGFVMGSEMRGLTTLRSDASTYPAAAALKALVADCRSMLGAETLLGYSADWNEYFGQQPADGSGDVFFHLDPLWSDANVSFIGVDWYAPITDWRDAPGGTGRRGRVRRDARSRLPRRAHRRGRGFRLVLRLADRASARPAPPSLTAPMASPGSIAPRT